MMRKIRISLIKSILILIGFAAAPPARADIAASAQVQVDGGLLQGVSTGDVAAFKNIPYAAPPVGALRWAPPQPPPAWSGARDASAFGPICPQTVGRGTPAGAAQSEDCLSLNVWAPVKAAAAPVMVWIHGGGDTQGTASQPQFDGSGFAKDGVIFVSIQYRLGLLGWFAHPALTRAAGPAAPLADYGLMDQIAALKRVQRNIAAFGGDPKRVTVAGESAGGEAVLFLMTNPAAKGLFAQAVVESGTGWAGYSPLATQEARGAALAQKMGLPASADAAALRALPLAQIMQAGGDQFAGAVIDGRLVKAAPAEVFAAHQQQPIPLLIGSNNGEDNLLGDSPPGDVLKDFTADQLAALRQAYGAEVSDDATLAHDIFRDLWMGAPARWIARQQAAHAPAYLYHFAYVPQIMRFRTIKAGHGLEMLFVFQAMDRAPVPLRVISASDQDEMSLVHGCWASFVKTGAPNCAAWPAYTTAGDQLLDFGDQAVVRTGFDKAAYDILDGIEAQRLTAARGR